MSSLDFIRLETIHPALVHFTIGAVPLLLLAYAMAAWRRSERWTFVGDVAAVLTAALSLGTLAFGLISNAIVPWPGGLGTWRYLHLGLGVLSAVLLVALAAGRVVVARRSKGPAGKRTLAAVCATSLVILVTGWIGGEVLVFHAGVAVKGAGEGSLAPPAGFTGGEPDGIVDAMGDIRAHWAVVVTTLGQVLVEKPSKPRLDRIAIAAVRLEELAQWLTDEGAREAADHGATPAQFSFMADRFGEHAAELQHAAADRDLTALSRAAGELGASCAGCHESFRWNHEHSEHRHAQSSENH